ncbi:casein kinase 2 regulatory subunit [Polyrhizophydium stewartii]|uniref:Casein kinase II subunit beta n=1 Tax=Polyrhizophydium stewartii TaxID=2732419 RepID=A0ABR4NEB6_9FUNG|nr:casein kinase 2 regulatory subunit [Polyrhizophydium stewartii]
MFRSLRHGGGRDLQHTESPEGSDVSNSSWVEWFLSLRGNEFFCEVDEEYLLDRFNLAGLNAEVKHYNFAYDLITDAIEEDLQPAMWDEVEKSARHLYGLIHARFVLTNRGLSKMLEKLKLAEFGRCPRVLCHNQAVLPVGLSDICGNKGVKLYCPRCEDVYSPPSRKHAVIDGAYFTTSLPHMLLQMFPTAMPPKSNERYVPRIFGFRLHQSAEEQRKQDQIREEAARRVQAYVEE